MQLPLLLMNPAWSADLLDYRYRVHAYDKLSSSWSYFWESGFTGAHLDIYREMARATHVPADVAFAVRQHLSATHDIKWFHSQGCEMAYQTARYWAKRVVYNATSELYDLSGIGTTSKDQDPLTNVAFLNVAAGYNLYLGDFAACVCGYRDSGFGEVARSLALPYDNKNELVKVHEDYETYIRTSGADALLTIFPLQYPLNVTAKNSTLDHYHKSGLKTLPPTTWALHLIGDIETQRERLEHSLFYSLTSTYTLRPFNVWTDQPIGTNTMYNFVPGAAAYLQVLMNGYGAIRLHFDRMEINSPKLPPDSTRMLIKGITYLEAKFSLELSQMNLTVKLIEKSLRKNVLLVVQIDDQVFPFDSVGETGKSSTFIHFTKTN